MLKYLNDQLFDSPNMVKLSTNQRVENATREEQLTIPKLGLPRHDPADDLGYDSGSTDSLSFHDEPSVDDTTSDVVPALKLATEVKPIGLKLALPLAPPPGESSVPHSVAQFRIESSAHEIKKLSLNRIGNDQDKKMLTPKFVDDDSHQLYLMVVLCLLVWG